MSAPVICRACGGPIEEPLGWHLCNKCFHNDIMNTPRPDPDDSQFWRDERERLAMQSERLEDFRRSTEVIPDHPEARRPDSDDRQKAIAALAHAAATGKRPDPDDLTPILVRMTQQEHDEAVRQKWQKRGAWCFTGLAIAAAIVIIVWGWRQCL